MEKFKGVKTRMENKMEQEPKEERRISKREKKGSAKFKDFALDTNPLDI